jgi:alanine-glyoxylate transaminase/serine-glyoxylate transaminase/serine-pyruvate transaminase
MLPPGLAFNAVSDKALAAAAAHGAPRGYWDWRPVAAANRHGRYPYTPASNMFCALVEALALIEAEGLAALQARHRRHAEATRAAVAAWGLETVCRDPAAHSSTLTAVRLPDGHDADAFRGRVLERFNLALGNGLGRLAGRVFRIGHLGDFNDLMLAGTLAGVEMGLGLADIPHAPGGVQAALEVLAAEG